MMACQRCGICEEEGRPKTYQTAVRPNSNLEGRVGVGGGEELTEARAQTSNRRWIPGMSCAGRDKL